MTDIEKAREWANRGEHLVDVIHPDAQAAIEIIRSLPDQWVDVEKVREVISSQLSEYPRGTVGHCVAEEIARDLEALLPPKLPTLADMTQEELEACQWMQCEIDGQIAGILARVDEQRGHIWIDSGYSLGWKLENITPLPDLPKLQWPGSGNTTTISNKEKVADDQAVAKDVCNSEPNSSETPKSSINPAEVPPNEPWLVEVNGEKAIGTRYRGDADVPWSVAALDGAFAGDYSDSEVTLIHKLVAETTALPEGMRLADHKTYGRVVVAPRANTHGEESFYRMNEDISWGASHGYRPTGEFNFLDGDQNA